MADVEHLALEHLVPEPQRARLPGLPIWFGMYVPFLQWNTSPPVVIMSSSPQTHSGSWAVPTMSNVLPHVRYKL